MNALRDKNTVHDVISRMPFGTVFSINKLERGGF
jgi:hypothetical protein